MLLDASNPLQVTTGTSSTPALLEVSHDIVHFREIFRGHTDGIKNNLIRYVTINKDSNLHKPGTKYKPEEV